MAPPGASMFAVSRTPTTAAVPGGSPSPTQQQQQHQGVTATAGGNTGKADAAAAQRLLQDEYNYIK